MSSGPKSDIKLSVRAGAPMGLDGYYYDDVDIYTYDETVVAHPYMDAIKALIVSEVTKVHLGLERTISVLDAGCGSGQLCRTLAALPFLSLQAVDIDPTAAEFFQNHPETSNVSFEVSDISNCGFDENTEKFDISVMLGVFHHIPPNLRIQTLQNLASVSDYVLVADEGILKYVDDKERRANARVWYEFVIREARRRGIHKLADLEAEFMQSDTSAIRELTDDFKESPEKIAEYGASAGLELIAEYRTGPWEELKGGMYLSVFKALNT